MTCLVYHEGPGQLDIARRIMQEHNVAADHCLIVEGINLRDVETLLIPCGATVIPIRQIEDV